MQIKNFKARPYQENILNTCKNHNTLVCIPTGLGKTKIEILSAIERLNKHKNSKALIVTPTKPLANQICNEFKECTTINESKIILLTGTITPNKREKLYKEAIVIVATPQTIEKDIKNKRINLENFSILIIDEAHRSRERFANTIVAKEYMIKSKNKRILGLTASPGSTKAKIEEICQNLYIETIEIRSEQDEDVTEFVQTKDIEYINVDFIPELKAIHDIIKEVYKSKLEGLKNFNITKAPSQITKVDLLMLQKRLIIGKKNPSTFYGMYLTAQLLKLSHAMEMLETQGLSSLNDFLTKLETEETKAAKAITNDKNIINAKKVVKGLLKNNIDHPKINKLKEIVKETLKNKNNSRIIIFTTYRNTVENIIQTLKSIKIKAIKLVGQKEGLSQKEQVEAIHKFNSGEYNCLVTTSIGEEGIHIGEADVAIFYDNTPSSIRKIQRTGRVGRLKPGRVIFMITKNTRDAAYHFKSQKDEKKMKNILYKMKGKPIRSQKKLQEF